MLNVVWRQVFEASRRMERASGITNNSEAGMSRLPVCLMPVCLPPVCLLTYFWQTWLKVLPLLSKPSKSSLRSQSKCTQVCRLCARSSVQAQVPHPHCHAHLLNCALAHRSRTLLGHQRRQQIWSRPEIQTSSCCRQHSTGMASPHLA